MENTYKVAVLLQAFNGENWIVPQINSILNQDISNLDIFINLDESSDATLEILRANFSENASVKICVNSERMGSASQNLFSAILKLDLNQYDYISISDQDDIWVKNKLSRAINKLKEKEADGYSSGIEAFWDNGKKVKIKKAYPQAEYDYMFESAGPGSTYVINSYLYKNLKENLQNNNYINKIGGGEYDWYIYYFARINGYKWYIDDFYSVKYRQHTNNLVGVNYGLAAKIRRIKKVICKNMFLHSLLFMKISRGENYQCFFNTKLNLYLFFLLNFYKFRRKKIDKGVFLIFSMIYFIKSLV